MAAANGGTVLAGIFGGIVGATGLFYGLTVAQPFGAYTPPDQNEAWQVKTEDLMVEGKWAREAGGAVHLNPIMFKVSGAEFARQCLKSADAENDDE